MFEWTDINDPMRKNERMEHADAKWTNCRTDRDEPNRDRPVTDRELPILAKAFMERELPRVSES
jgi:hypothetical protein